MNFSYNPDFYPTPQDVINTMLMDDSPAGLVVLEPSAGSGNIARALRDAGAAEVLTCEIDPNLQPILRRDGFRLIASDFMSVTAEQISHVNMIVMNPPFSQGVRHIRHAYDIAPAGCCIVALCNSSNLESGYYSHYREFAELVKLHGYSEDLGDVFSTAERRTACRVSLVKLWKEGEGADEFSGYFSAYDEDTQEGQQGEIMQYNFLRDIVNRHIEAVKMFDAVQEMTHKINLAATYVDYTVKTDENTGEQKAVKHEYGAPPVMFEAVAYNNSNGRREATNIDHATYKKELQKYYWRIIFQKMNMEKYATRELREQINRFIEQRQNVPFTMGNIYRVIETVVKTNSQRMTRALCEAFDTICSLSAENSTAGETWKTNSNYMVNRRFICDYITSSSWGGNMEIIWRSHNDHAEQMDDVTKALCYMTGKEFKGIGSLREHVRKAAPEWGKWFEWGFFRCRGYKKGTMHFEFLDEKVWARFNQEVAKSKGWKIGSTTNSEHGHKQNRRK